MSARWQGAWFTRVLSGYSATKAGLRLFTLGMAEELRGSGIKVALVSPGPVSTGFIMDDMDKVSDITFSQPMTSATDVAQAVLDLCSNTVQDEALPKLSGVLTTVVGLMPWLGRALRPSLERKGQRVKKELKAQGAGRDRKRTVKKETRKGGSGSPGWSLIQLGEWQRPLH